LIRTEPSYRSALFCVVPTSVTLSHHSCLISQHQSVRSVASKMRQISNSRLSSTSKQLARWKKFQYLKSCFNDENKANLVRKLITQTAFQSLYMKKLGFFKLNFFDFCQIGFNGSLLVLFNSEFDKDDVLFRSWLYTVIYFTHKVIFYRNIITIS
jgi:hypothetical protein